MKKNRIFYLLAILFVSGLIVSCQKQNQQNFEDVDSLVESVKAGITEVTPEEVKKLYDGDDPYLIIDVREKNEFDRAYIPGAINIPRGLVEFRIAKETYWEEEMLYMPLKEELIIVCCKKGHRGALTAAALQSLGYTNVKNVEGGLNAWKAAYPDLVEKNEIATAGAMMNATSSGADDGGC